MNIPHRIKQTKKVGKTVQDWALSI